MSKRAGESFIGVGKSNLGIAKQAGVEAAKLAMEKLQGHKPSFALIFASAGYDQKKLLTGISSVIGKTPSCGCSGEGIITPEGSDESSSTVGIMLFAGDNLGHL